MHYQLVKKEERKIEMNAVLKISMRVSNAPGSLPKQVFSYE